MKKFIQTFALAIGSLIIAQCAIAAVIQWDAPTAYAPDAFDSLNTEGYLAEAINAGGGQVTVNSVNRGPLTFAASDIWPERGSFDPNGVFPAVTSSDAGLNTLLNGSDWTTSGNPTTITVGSRGGTLKPGSRYIVQFFALDTRNLSLSSRTVTFGDGNGNDITVGLGQNSGGPSTIIGRFVADDFTQNITIGGSAHPYLAGYYLQSVAKFVPEPGTVSMMAIGLGLIAVTRRKLYKYND